MTFDKELVEAKLGYGSLLSDDWPGLAWSALEAGYDGTTLRRLAGLDKPSGWEIDQLIPALVEELSLRKFNKKQGAIALAQYWAKRILADGTDPLDELPRFYSLFFRSGYPIELGGIGSLDDECYWGDKGAVRAKAFGELRWLVQLDLNDEADTRHGPLGTIRLAARQAHFQAGAAGAGTRSGWSQWLRRVLKIQRSS